MDFSADVPSRRGRRNAPPDAAPAPAVALPHVVITVSEDGALDVAVDGSPFPAPAEGQAWTRSAFGGLLDAITHERTVAVRIEVRENDGSVFTDIIQASRPKQSKPAEVSPRDPRGKHTKTGHKQAPELVEVIGEGFVPGEDISVAVVVAHTDATGTGHARTLIDTTRLAPALPGGTGEVVLLGRVSGTLHIRRLPR